jgi:protease-4
MSGQEKSGLMMRVLGWVWAFVRFYLIAIGLMVTVTVILITITISNLSQQSSVSFDSHAEERGILELKLEGRLVESRPDVEEQLYVRFLGGKLPMALDDLQVALRRAQKDPNIEMIFLNIGELESGMATITELRRYLQNVRESGKRVEAYASSLDTSTYYLASVAERIYLAPAGGLSIFGPAFQMVYFGDALRRLGVDVEVLKAGKFKSAFEPFITNDPSPDSLLAYQTVEESMRAFLVEDIAASRNKSVEEVRRWMKVSLYSSTDAQKEGIIDGIHFVNEVKDKLIESLKSKDPEEPNFLSLKRYLRQSKNMEKDDHSTSKDGIALIEARGNIVMQAGADGDEFDPDQIRSQVEWALDEEHIKSVVLRVDSPGGSAEASDLMWHDLKRLAEKKPLIVSFGDTAASGGYYIATAGQKIISEGNTITGSIGVIGAVPNFAAFREKYGVSFHMVTQSERAQLLNPGQKSSAFDKAIVENQIDQTYKLFLQRVASGRQMSVEQVHELAQGRIYSGRQALELKLVDDLGGLDEAFKLAKQLGELDEKKLHTIYSYEEPAVSLRDCLHNFTNFSECFGDLEGTKLTFSLEPKALSFFRRAMLGRERVFLLAPMSASAADLKHLLP